MLLVTLNTSVKLLHWAEEIQEQLKARHPWLGQNQFVTLLVLLEKERYRTTKDALKATEESTSVELCDTTKLEVPII